MISGTRSILTLARPMILGALALVCLGMQPALAQFGIGFNNRVGVVGGISVDADGAVRNVSLQERDGYLQSLRNVVREPGRELEQPIQLRMVSLSKLQREIERAMAADEPLSDAVLYLAGLQRVEYVFVYPESNDIVLAGPAEGWTVRQDATVVGKKSGRPVLQLEDLLTALRTVEAARQQAISVSIDPTPEGEQRLNQLLSQVRTGGNFNPAVLESAMRKAFGPQMVKLSTVPQDSRMAQTLVAADYRMKRLAMNLDESPVAGLPSYMEMIRHGGTSAGAQPRWWIACDYDALLHSEDKLAWRLTGLGVKALTEDEYVDPSGTRSGTGRANQLAQRWADSFTEKFDELCVHNAAFGDLRNCMDLNIVATLISAHDLEKVAGCDFGLLRGQDGKLELPAWSTPQTIDPECSFIRGRSGWTVSASGGVEINPWKVVSQDSRPAPELSGVRSSALQNGDNWWWN